MPKKTKDIWISFPDAVPEPPRLSIGNDPIERANVFKLLGVSVQNNLKWNAHVEEITRKATINASLILENAENRNHQLKSASLLINPK